MSIDDTLKERGNNYGEFTTQGMYTQRLKELFRDEDGSWESMDDDMKEALDMIASKIARLINGDPYHIDSWHDIQGYARLIEARLIKEEQDEFDFDKAFDIQEYPTASPPFLVQPVWNIDPAFHPYPDMVSPKVVSEVDFHGIHITGDEVTQGYTQDDFNKDVETINRAAEEFAVQVRSELPKFDPGKDAWVKPGFAEEPSTKPIVGAGFFPWGEEEQGMEAAHGALPPDISKL